MKKRLKFLLDDNSREDFANFEEMGLYKKSKKQRPLKEKKKDKKKTEIILDDDEDSSTDVDETGMDAEEYKDEGENDMQVILKAVNDLSSRIISRMARGVNSADSNTSDDILLPGLIVDGALALSNLDNLNIEHSSSDRWISQDDILTVCPNLKLADYQLIGVNSLWLLHGLTCDLAAVGLNSRKDLSSATVNGTILLLV